jgi:predicted metal-dependent phosphoesterase TrpH
MTPRLLLVAVACAAVLARAQEGPRPLPVPDIPGYVTLKADFHLHSVFSDGEVWPTVHVREAARDGLDAIALTEHIEYRPHKGDVSGDALRAYEAARPMAEKLGVLLVPGVEITRPAPGTRSDWPPGSAHFNALFVTDPAALDTPELAEALRRAGEQDAFVFWNHPGFMGRQAEWFPHIEPLFAAGRFRGVEVVNGDQFYPEALRWAHERQLTPLACSDAHLPMPAHLTAARRPVTLVFARTRDLAGLKEALAARRTVAWRDRELWGDATYLAALWKASVSAAPARVAPDGAFTLRADNASAIDFDVAVTRAPAWLTMDGATIRRQSATPLAGRVAPGAPAGTHRVTLGIALDNLRAEPDRPLTVEWPIEIVVER